MAVYTGKPWAWEGDTGDILTTDEYAVTQESASGMGCLDDSEVSPEVSADPTPPIEIPRRRAKSY